MLIGMFTRRENERRLDALEKALAAARRAGRFDDVAELEADRRELLAWFRDLERIEG